jgi:hypothetical protein
VAIIYCWEIGMDDKCRVEFSPRWPEIPLAKTRASGKPGWISGPALKRLGG